MNRAQVIDGLFSESQFGPQNSAIDRRLMRNRLLNMSGFEFAKTVWGGYGLKPTTTPRKPSRDPVDRWPPFESTAPADEIGRLRHRIETQSTAHHEAVHGCAVCYFGDSSNVIYIEADGGGGCCRYSGANLDLAAERRITLAPVVALSPSYWLSAPGYSGDRSQYLDMLRESGNRGDDYDLLSSFDARGDEEAVNEMLQLCSPFIKKLGAAIIRNGRLMGDSVHAKWQNHLRENPWLKDRLPRR